MNNKLLVICGPTSTGKTKLAISFAKKFNGEIVSADSRQVYKGMNIGTGKDLPKDAKIKYPWFGKYGYYEIDGAKIWGYDLADPRHEYSVAQYLKFAERIIKDIVKRDKLPILVGGTGLYIKGVIDGIPTATIPKNNKLRSSLEKKTADELFEMLAQMDSIRAAEMNSSDKKNPRRLIRAVEVAMWKISHVEMERKIEKKKTDFDALVIGLGAPEKFINARIALRVTSRLDEGIIQEIEKLLRTNVTWDMQSMSSMGYGQWRDYFEGGVSKEQIIQEWEKEERKYAKRQITWFKKDRRVTWFDVTNKDFPQNIEKTVKKWYKGD